MYCFTSVFMFCLISLNVLVFKEFVDMKKECTDIKKEYIEFKNKLSYLAETTNEIKDRIIGNEEMAEKSLAYAKELINKKDFSNARIYCFNAINHSRHKADGYKTLLLSLIKDEKVPLGDLKRAEDIIKIGLDVVTIDNVESLKGMLSNVRRMIKEYAKKTPKLTVFQHYQMGQKYFKNADFKNATYHFQEAAVQGHEGAKLMLERYDNVLK